MDASYVRPLSDSVRRPQADAFRVDPALTAWAVLLCAAFVVCTGLMLQLARTSVDDRTILHHFEVQNGQGFGRRAASDIDADGTAFAFAEYNTVQYAKKDGPVIHMGGSNSSLPASGVYSVHTARISPSKDVLAVGGLSWNVGAVLELWRVNDTAISNTSSPMHLELGTGEIVRILAFSPQGDILIAGTRRQDGKGARLVFIRPATGQILIQAKVPEAEITALCFPAGSQDGTFLFAAGSASGAGAGRLCRGRFDGAACSIETVAQFPAVVAQIDATPDASLIALATSDSVVRVLRPDGTAAGASVTRAGKNISALCLDATGDVIFAEWDVAVQVRSTSSIFGPRYESSILRLAIQDAAPTTIWQGRGEIGCLRFDPADRSILAADLQSGRVFKLP